MPGREGAARRSVVVIEDDPSICELLQLYLSREQYLVRKAGTGVEGIDLVKSAVPSLVILDLMLPDLSGFDVLKTVRTFSKVPVIVLTARDADQELGADDYMVKPFSPGELVARARAVLRRTGEPGDGEAAPQVLGGITLVPDERTVRVDGAVLELTPKEFELLHYLLLNRGLALTRERLLDQVWGYMATRGRWTCMWASCARSWDRGPG